MAKINGLEKLSYADLIDLQKRVEAAIVDRKAAEARDIRQKLEALASQSGFSVGELFGGKRGGRKGTVAVKYRNPKDACADLDGSRPQADLAGRSAEEGRQDRQVPR